MSQIVCRNEGEPSMRTIASGHCSGSSHKKPCMQCSQPSDRPFFVPGTPLGGSPLSGESGEAKSSANLPG